MFISSLERLLGHHVGIDIPKLCAGEARFNARTTGQLGDDGVGVRNGVDRQIVALECFGECFGHSVGLKAADRRRARLHSDIPQQRFRACRNKS